jgi:RimJ/RimL family protein N-acetyltransferase
MLRLAIHQDFEVIYALYMDVHNNPFLLYEHMEKEFFLPIYTDLINEKVKYVFEVTGKIVGMCKLIPQPYRNSHILYLGGVAIAPNATGKGYGSLLMQAIIKFAKEHHYKRIELTVATHNTTAIHLYQKMGFVQEGILKNFTYLEQQNLFVDEAMMALLL